MFFECYRFKHIFDIILDFFSFDLKTKKKNIGRQSTTKQEVELPVVNHRICKNKFEELGISLNNDQLCAGGVWV